MKPVRFVPEETRAGQERAADPAGSAWVSANAGSGKTHVLSRRVVRLLLGGADPSRILCLTYTKAAAANMANRVFRDLSRWTMLDDVALAAEIGALDGAAADAEGLARARRLFAQALETPGGLKIQTIHAFCEAVLHQFPLEANIAGHFEMLDGKAEELLVAEARLAMLTGASGSEDRALADAFATVLSLGGESGLDGLLGEIVARRDALRAFRAAVGEDHAPLYEEFGFVPGTTPAAVAEAAWPVPGFSLREFETFDLLAVATDARSVVNDILPDAHAAFRTADPVERIRLMASAFLTGKGEPYGERQFKLALRNQIPDLMQRYEGAAKHLTAAQDRLAAIGMVEATVAALTVADRLLGRYERLKAARGLLDFNDLIARTASLLARSDAAPWVQYRLDRGIDHILVDEAQDTSPTQWRIVERLADDFFSGEGARGPAHRTMFAVGDEKQSIYSFQGAEPAAFAETRELFRQRVEAVGQPFAEVRLKHSFRSTEDVLSAVDHVFGTPERRKGLTRDDEEVVHAPIRANEPGQVDVWDSIGAVKVDEPDDWTEAIDHASKPAVLLAERIARTVKSWIVGGERLEADGRRIRPGDVMVLVRKRDSFVHALARALKNVGIPVAGADRLHLTAHIAVKDLMALGRFVLQPGDDLSLAALLRSPVFNLTEEQLFDLAHPRGRGETLWTALRKAAATDLTLAPVVARLEGWRREADFAAPFEFYATLLARDGVRRDLLARLGAEASEVLDEFLGFCLAEERVGLPGLEAFLATLERAGPEIKREMEQGRDEVRIMTVHAAKGLEAPVVFLADPGGAPFHASHLPRLLGFTSARGLWRGRGFLWRAGKALANTQSRAIEALHRERAEEEYRRLLYVALTRAEDRLVVCGFHGAAQHPQCWHAMVGAALRPHSVEIGEPGSADHARRFRIAAPRPVAEPKAEAGRPTGQRAPYPALGALPPRPAVQRPLAPSGVSLVLGAGPEPATLAASPVLDPQREPGFGARRGTAVHRLLQMLPGMAQEERDAASLRWLARFAPEWSEAERTAVADSVKAVLDHPDFAALFSGRARAEVALMGRLRLGGEARAVAARIDRLCVGDDRILMVDFKTTRPAPETLASVDPAHVAQMALYRALLAPLYPGRAIEAALVYTDAPRLIRVDEAAMAASLAALGLS